MEFHRCCEAALFELSSTFLVVFSTEVETVLVDHITKPPEKGCSTVEIWDNIAQAYLLYVEAL